MTALLTTDKLLQYGQKNQNFFIHTVEFVQAGKNKGPKFDGLLNINNSFSLDGLAIPELILF